MPATMRLQSAGLTDAGTQRDNNEDRILCEPEQGVFAVIDGMGGHAAGEKAAAIAHDVLRQRLSRQTGTAEERLREAITLANNEIFRHALSHEDWRGMACVLTAALIEEESLIAGHVGDSRLYLLRAGVIRKLTHDHSPVGEREDKGELTEVQAMKHPRRNEVFRDCGSAEHSPGDANFIDVMRVPLPLDAAILLCTDGLTDQVDSDHVRRTAERNAGVPYQTARELIEAANAAGGKDNVSVIVVEGAGYVHSVRAQARAKLRKGDNARALKWSVFFVALLVALGVWMWKSRSIPDPPTPAPAPRGVAAARTIIVSTGASIAVALAAAAAGDTILVAPGTYRENLQMKSGVQLASRDLHRAVIEAPGAVVIAAGVTGARISGFRLAGPAETGILIDGGNLTVAQMDIRGMTRAAIELRKDAASLIAGNALTGNGRALILGDNAAPRIEDNSMMRNGSRGAEPSPSVEIRDAAQPVFRRNTIRGAGIEEIWAHPLFDTGALLRNNAIGRPRQDNRGKIRVLTP